MDLTTALQLVLRKSLAHGGLTRGLHEAAKVIEKHAAQLCVLAEDCDQQDYVKLVKALCADHNVKLVTVPSAKTLGEWSGVSRFSLVTDEVRYLSFLIRFSQLLQLFICFINHCFHLLWDSLPYKVIGFFL